MGGGPNSSEGGGGGGEGGAGPSNVSPIAILHYTFKSC